MSLFPNVMSQCAFAKSFMKTRFVVHNVTFIRFFYTQYSIVGTLKFQRIKFKITLCGNFHFLKYRDGILLEDFVISCYQQIDLVSPMKQD